MEITKRSAQIFYTYYYPDSDPMKQIMQLNSEPKCLNKSSPIAHASITNQSQIKSDWCRRRSRFTFCGPWTTRCSRRPATRCKRRAHALCSSRRRPRRCATTGSTRTARRLVYLVFWKRFRKKTPFSFVSSGTLFATSRRTRRARARRSRPG